MSYGRAKVESSVGVQLGLIITPMLDMSFQILAFFIMTYHPSALEEHLAGSLAAQEIGKADVGEPQLGGPLALDGLDAPTAIVKTDGGAPGRPDKVLRTRKRAPPA